MSKPTDDEIQLEEDWPELVGAPPDKPAGAPPKPAAAPPLPPKVSPAAPAKPAIPQKPTLPLPVKAAPSAPKAPVEPPRQAPPRPPPAAPAKPPAAPAAQNNPAPPKPPPPDKPAPQSPLEPAPPPLAQSAPEPRPAPRPQLPLSAPAAKPAPAPPEAAPVRLPKPPVAAPPKPPPPAPAPPVAAKPPPAPAPVIAAPNPDPPVAPPPAPAPRAEPRAPESRDEAAPGPAFGPRFRLSDSAGSDGFFERDLPSRTASRASSARAPAPDRRTGLANSLCVFWLQDKAFALETSIVGEVVSVEQIAEVPLAPPAIEGIFNLRGTPVALVDLAAVLDLPTSPRAPEEAGRSATALVLRDQHVIAALRVQRIDLILPAGRGVFAPSTSAEEHPVVSGILEVEGRAAGAITVLDTQALLHRLEQLRFR